MQNPQSELQGDLQGNLEGNLEGGGIAIEPDDRNEAYRSVV